MVMWRWLEWKEIVFVRLEVLQIIFAVCPNFRLLGILRTETKSASTSPPTFFYSTNSPLSYFKIGSLGLSAADIRSLTSDSELPASSGLLRFLHSLPRPPLLLALSAQLHRVFAPICAAQITRRFPPVSSAWFPGKRSISRGKKCIGLRKMAKYQLRKFHSSRKN